MNGDKLHALIFNAITKAVGDSAGWVPLSTREQATEAALAVIRPELAYQAEVETCTCDRVDVSFGAIGDQPLTRQSMPGLRDPDCPFHGRGQQ